MPQSVTNPLGVTLLVYQAQGPHGSTGATSKLGLRMPAISVSVLGFLQQVPPARVLFFSPSERSARRELALHRAAFFKQGNN